MRETASVNGKFMTKKLPCLPGKALVQLGYRLEFPENWDETKDYP